MSDSVKETQETFVDIKQDYVDEKLRGFFSTEGKDVNIDNICLFAAKTIEEYNSKAEKKLQGKQKLEAATELAKSVVERSVAFVPEDFRRQVVKNIYHNIDNVEQTMQFIVDLSNNPNLVNFDKWVKNLKRTLRNGIMGENEETTDDGKSKRGLFGRCFGCIHPKSKPEEEREQSDEPTPVSADEAVVEDKVEESAAEHSSPKISKKEAKKEAKKKAEAEKIRRKLVELSMTPEEREEKKKAEEAEKEEKKAEAAAKKKAEKEEKKAEAAAKEKAKMAAKAENLRRKLEEIEGGGKKEEVEAEDKVEESADCSLSSSGLEFGCIE